MDKTEERPQAMDIKNLANKHKEHHTETHYCEAAKQHRKKKKILKAGGEKDTLCSSDTRLLSQKKREAKT